MDKMFLYRSILHGYKLINPLVFWYQWEYLLTSKEFVFFAGYLRLAMYIYIYIIIYTHLTDLSYNYIYIYKYTLTK